MIPTRHAFALVLSGTLALSPSMPAAEPRAGGAPAIRPPDVEGCFLLHRAAFGDVREQGGTRIGSSFLARETLRCLCGDGRVVERRTVTYSLPDRSYGDESFHLGRWSASGGALALQWDEGGTGEWGFERLEGGFSLGGEIWTRAEADPETLRAAAESTGAATAVADEDDAEEDEAGLDGGAGHADEVEPDAGAALEELLEALLEDSAADVEEDP